ncbi:MAG: thioredoxin domain-containing protein [Caulobacteraceae bacterium]
MNAPRAAGLAALLAVALVAGAATAPPAGQEGDMALGSPRAAVTVIEYASAGCPHCASWERQVFPAFKAKYIDTGKARFVFREMLYGDADLAAAAFLTARCAGRGKYFQVVDAVFADQAALARAASPAALAQIAKEAGLSQARFDACLQDKGAIAALQARVERHEKEDAITGTPTFVVAGRKLEGDQSLAELAAAIAAAPRR